jgi:hypothetical protein
LAKASSFDVFKTAAVAGKGRALEQSIQAQRAPVRKHFSTSGYGSIEF